MIPLEVGAVNISAVIITRVMKAFCYPNRYADFGEVSRTILQRRLLSVDTRNVPVRIGALFPIKLGSTSLPFGNPAVSLRLCLLSSP